LARQTPAGQPRIFISYRREQTSAYAGRLYDRLAQEFGESSVFMDVASIVPGEDFAQAIERVVENSSIALVIIGHKWADIRDDEGHRKIDDPGDWVRLEIEASLRKRLPVLPVLVAEAKMPSREELPSSLASFSRRQAVVLSDASFRRDASELIEILKKNWGIVADKKDEPAHRDGFGETVAFKVQSEVNLDVLIDGERVLTVDHSQGFSYATGNVVVHPDSRIVFRGAGFEVARLARLLVDARTRKAEAWVGSDSTRCNILLTKDQVKRAMGERSDVPDIVRTLSASQDGNERAWAAERLGYIGDVAAVPALVEVLKGVHSGQGDADSWVQAQAAEAIGRIGDPSALPVLKRAFDDYPNKGSHGYMFEAAIRHLQSKAVNTD
jgi:TIR domain/HEAT repeats